MVNKPPNILFILTDQQRLSAVGAYGETPCQTPHIDRLASEGTRFHNTYTTCPVCSPARGSLMTGLYPHAHGITSNIHELNCAVHALADRPSLLSRRLQSAGYQAGYTGKWHLGTDQQEAFGGPNTPSLPGDVGFTGHNIPGHGDGGIETSEYHTYLQGHGWRHECQPWPHRLPMLRRAGELTGPVESTVPFFLTEHTIGLMERFRRSEEPFFLWHNFWGPHEPYYAPTEYVDLYRDVDIPPWPNFDWDARHIPGPHHVKIHPEAGALSWEDWLPYVRYYYAFASLIDAQVGRLLHYLDETGLSENTIVVFAADHGETLGSHGGLVDKGWHHFEETHRVPLIVRMPGQDARVCDQLVSLVDVYPTLLDAAGVVAPENLHGKSLLPLVRGEHVTWRDYALTEFGGLGHLGATLRTLRVGTLKYGFNAGFADELYDLSHDPHETKNLIHDPAYQRPLRELRARLEGLMDELEDPALRMFRFAMAYENRENTG